MVLLLCLFLDHTDAQARVVAGHLTLNALDDPGVGRADRGTEAAALAVVRSKPAILSFATSTRMLESGQKIQH